MSIWLCIFVAIIVYNFIFKYIVSLFRIKEVQNKAVVITGCDSGKSFNKIELKNFEGFGRDLAKRCLQHGFTAFAACFSKHVSQF